jgi:hypothetical protein
MISAGRVFTAIRPARIGMGLPSGCLQLADFVAVAGDCFFPARAAVDETGMCDQGLERLDALGFDQGRHGGDPSRLPGFGPGLPERPAKAFTADVCELDQWIFVGFTENRPGAAHDS